MSRHLIYISIFSLLVLGTLYFGAGSHWLHESASANATVPPGATIPPNKALTLVIKPLDNAPDPGDVVQFELTLDNIAGVELRNLQLEVAVPQFSNFQPGSSTPGWEVVLATGTFAGTNGTPCPNMAPAGTICRYNLSKLAAGKSRKIFYAIQVNSDIPKLGGPINLIATVNGAQLNGELPSSGRLDVFKVTLLPVFF